MAAPSEGTQKEKASWDEANVDILLRLLVEQIDGGHRPGGQFTSQAWATITTKFAEESGDNFSVTQLKNKWDNMKKEFSLWEKLLLEETGLGYDHISGRIVADSSWWRKKLQEKPEYRRFKTQGPLHLHLQKMVFKGIVATGRMEYIPESDPLLGDDAHIEEIGQQTPFGNDGLEPPTQTQFDDGSDTDCQPVETDLPSSSRGKRKQKRKKPTTSSKNATVGDVNDNMMEYINVMKQESLNSVQSKQTDNVISYEESIDLLLSVPWIEPSSPYFIHGLALLEDRKKRTALAKIIHLGEHVVKSWMSIWINK